MINVQRIRTYGWEGAFRGMRNPMNSWEKADSEFDVECRTCDNEYYKCETCPCSVAENGNLLGPNDLELAMKLSYAGPPHRKFLRMIHIQMDITAPLYWWKEFDTYKVGTTANSCSTMHKIQDKEFILDDFSFEHLDMLESYTIKGEHITNFDYLEPLKMTITALNVARNMYLETKDKKYWWQMIQLLPSSYNQKRTVDMSYETAFNMIEQRENHKLSEWNKFTNELYLMLPYMKDFMR